MKNPFKIFFSITCFIFIFLFLSNPNYYSTVALEGLNLFFLNVFPCLFPFFIATKILIELNCFSAIENTFSFITRPFSKEPKSTFVFFIAILCGAPISISTACQLYKKNLISKQSCENICIFCNFPGPIFILGTIGSFFQNNLIIAILYLSTIFGALLNGIIFSKRETDNFLKHHTELSDSKIDKQIFNNAINQSIKSILYVGSTIMLFYIVGKMIFSSVSNLPLMAESIIQSLLEITSGAKLTSSIPNRFLSVVATAGTLGFGGLCVYIQCCSFWQNSKINCFKMLIKKATQGVASMACCALLCILLKI